MWAHCLPFSRPSTAAEELDALRQSFRRALRGKDDEIAALRETIEEQKAAFEEAVVQIAKR